MNSQLSPLDELADIFTDHCKNMSDLSGMSDKPHVMGVTERPTQKIEVGPVGHMDGVMPKMPDTARLEKSMSDNRKPVQLCGSPDMPDRSDKKQVISKKQLPAAGNITVDPVEFSERAASLEYDAGMGRDEAEQTAALELGHVNAVALYEATITSWQQYLQPIAAIAAPQSAKEIVRDAQTFLTEWGLTALQMGWDEQDLFRCTAHDLEAIGMYSGFGKKPQLQRLGLIFFVHGGRVELMTRETATIRTVSGQTQSFPRYGPGHNQGGPIWKAVGDL